MVAMSCPKCISFLYESPRSIVHHHGKELFFSNMMVALEVECLEIGKRESHERRLSKDRMKEKHETIFDARHGEWCDGTIKASERRVLMATWLYEAW